MLNKKGKTHQRQYSNYKRSCRAGNRTRDLSHRALMPYMYTTETTEHIDQFQAVLIFQRNGSQHK